jgi:hypothetical protein
MSQASTPFSPWTGLLVQPSTAHPTPDTTLCDSDVASAGYLPGPPAARGATWFPPPKVPHRTTPADVCWQRPSQAERTLSPRQWPSLQFPPATPWCPSHEPKHRHRLETNRSGSAAAQHLASHHPIRLVSAPPGGGRNMPIGLFAGPVPVPGKLEKPLAPCSGKPRGRAPCVCIPFDGSPGGGVYVLGSPRQLFLALSCRRKRRKRDTAWPSTPIPLSRFCLSLLVKKPISKRHFFPPVSKFLSSAIVLHLSHKSKSPCSLVHPRRVDLDPHRPHPSWASPVHMRRRAMSD